MTRPNAPHDPHEKAGFRHMYRRHFGGLIVFIAMALGIVVFGIVRDNLALSERDVALGATFSDKYAEQLGIPWKDAYIATLDELGVRRLRIPVYWDEVEPSSGTYDFSRVDWMLDEAGKRGASVILAIGHKVPRWPECHTPDWANSLEGTELQDAVMKELAAAVHHFAGNPTVVMWQVENEPLFEFGNCPPPDVAFLKREVAEVRAMDSRPIMITESGELSTWVRAAAIGDVLGVSTYRSIWNRWIGYFYWPVTPAYYTRRAQVLSRFVDRIIISELQAEPWGPGPTEDLTIKEQFKSMNPKRLEDNIQFVRRTGFDEAYLWGVEWWYWLRQQGEPSMWEAGIRAFGGQPITRKNAPAENAVAPKNGAVQDSTSS